MMRNLINLVEANSDSMDREDHIVRLIRFAFEKIDLAINYNNHSVTYEDATREACVILEQDSISINKLALLYQTGLSDQDFVIEKGHDALRVVFTVRVDLDQAEISS
jgi:hypothetical protein